MQAISVIYDDISKEFGENETEDAFTEKLNYECQYNDMTL